MLKKYPEIAARMRTANWSRAEALSLMENWLNAHPGQIHGVIGQNDEMALGAIQAMKAAGIDPKTIPLLALMVLRRIACDQKRRWLVHITGRQGKLKVH